jgi:2-amino-4-hydroxy-6-hydroxymethyldihydropteridine diphosphokinase
MVGGTWYNEAGMSEAVHEVCLLLGSNIEPEQNIPRAIQLLKNELTIIKTSSVWESASQDCCYPDFLNIAVLVTTSLNAVELKGQVLRPLEARMGRVRTSNKNAPRPIDIDIILYGSLIIDPALWQHAYEAVPVAELLPEYHSEDGKCLKDVARRLAHFTAIKTRTDIPIRLD